VAGKVAQLSYNVAAHLKRGLNPTAYQQAFSHQESWRLG